MKRPNPPTIDLVIAKFVETRDRLAEMKKEFDNVCADLKALQDNRAAWLKTQMDTLGVKSLKSAHGIVFFVWKDSATVSDWEAFREWIIVNEEWEFLEHRVSKSAVKQRLDEGETPPPGINYTKLKDVQVRRK
jgi:hypothetical protein